MRRRFSSAFGFRLGVWGFVVLVAGQSAYALDPGRTLTQYLHRIWQVQQGLPQATLYSIRQTRDGYLWLGMQAGLVRFDGVQFTPIDSVGGVSLKDVWVRDLLEDPEGLWVATYGEGLVRVRKGMATRYTVQDGLPSDSVRDLMLDSHGALWVATAEGLARFSDGKFQAYRTAQGLAIDNLNAVGEAKDGSIWAGGDETRLSRWNGSGFTPIPLMSIPRYATVLALLGDEDGAIWAGTTSGLVRLKDGKEERFTTANGLADNWVLCLAQSRDGSLWVGTKDGFSRVRKGEIESFRGRDGLSQSSVYTLAEDREGSLWVGTKHGLNQFVDRRLVPFTASEGLPSNNTGPVLQDRQGNIWVGTQDAGLSRFDGRRFVGITMKEGLASNAIAALADDGGSGLWVGTDRGVNHLRDGHVDETYTTAQGLPASAIRCLLCDRQGTLWAGTAAGPAMLSGDAPSAPRGGTAGLPDARFVPPPGLKEPLRAPVVAVAERRDGSLVLATEGGGLYRWSAGKLSEMAQPNMPPRDIDAFYEDPDGLVWMGTLGGGLRLMRGSQVFGFSVVDGIFDDDIYGIVADDQDRLWMACSKGVFWISRPDLIKLAAGTIKSVVSTPFSPTDVMRTIECKSGVQPAAWRMKDGRLWLSTIRGVIVIDPAHMQITLPPAPVVIEDVTVDGRNETPSHIESLPPGRKNLEFRYTCLSFVSPPRMKFKYRLLGFDKDWIDAGGRREAFYTNLPPGAYRFEVMACNADGNWSAADPAVFVLAPHFYQRGWFIPLCVAAAGLAGFMGYRLRIRGIKKKLHDIVAERSRIARELHDTLLQGFSGVTMEMQALSTRLPASGERVVLQEIIRDAGNCMKEARRSVAGLRESRGQSSGLAAAVEQVARQATEAKEIRLKLTLQGPQPGLPADVEYNLVRIAQEAVANSVKHSGGRTVEVALDCSPNQVRLAVRDDGSGIPEKNGDGGAAGHYGLIGMKERATQIGAEFRIDTVPGRGTAVCVSFPKSERKRTEEKD